MVLKMSRMKYAPLLVFQLVLMVLYFVFVRYGDGEDVGVKGKKLIRNIKNPTKCKSLTYLKSVKEA